MNKVHYLESDEEITKVINRIRASEEDGVVLVVPRNSTLTQSMINLKLISRSASEHGKTIGLISTDRITKNLAEQLNIKVFAKVAEAESAALTQAVSRAKEAPEGGPVGVADAALSVNTYKKYDLSKVDGLNSGTEPATPELVDAEEAEDNDDEIKLAKKTIGEPIAETDEELEEVEPMPEEIERKEVKSNPKDDEMKSRLGGRKHIGTGGSRKPLIILAAVMVMVLLIFVVLFLPYAEASVMLKTADQSKKAVVLVDKNRTDFDAASATMAGKMVEIEKSLSKSFVPTGEKDAGAPATGMITISNTTDTKAIPVSPGTKVTAAGGKIFTIQSGVLVPGATISNPQLIGGKLTYDTTPGTIDAKVTSEGNGEDYNMAAETKFTLLSMTATNKAAFSGGTTKNILFIKEEDLDNAAQAIKDAALAENKAELLSNAEKDSLKIDEKNITLQIVTTSTDKKVNDETESFAVTAKIKLSALGFAETDLRNAMVALTSKDLNAETMLVNPEKSELTYVVSEYNAETNVLKLDTEFKAKTGANLSVDDLKKNTKGKNVQAAQEYLEARDGVSTVSLKYFPSFWKKMPFLTKRISVKFDFEE